MVVLDLGGEDADEVRRLAEADDDFGPGGFAGAGRKLADRQAFDLELVDLASDSLPRAVLSEAPGPEAADRGRVDGRDFAGFEVPLNRNFTRARWLRSSSVLPECEPIA